MYHVNSFHWYKTENIDISSIVKILVLQVSLDEWYMFILKRISETILVCSVAQMNDFHYIKSAPLQNKALTTSKKF